MIVSDEHKFLFLAIPKTGSGTVQTFLENFGLRSPGIAHLNHLTAKQMIEKVGNEKWKTYRKITFTRNPWDRYVSLWLWIRRFNKNQGVGRPFHEFKDYINGGGENGMHQRDFIFDDKGTIIIDFVGKFETLKDDLIKLARWLKVYFPEKIHHNNQNENKNRKHYTEYYTEQWMIDAVAERERFVINAFNYKFGEDGERWRGKK